MGFKGSRVRIPASRPSNTRRFNHFHRTHLSDTVPRNGDWERVLGRRDARCQALVGWTQRVVEESGRNTSTFPR